jgi:release factor glutamine methyltransferase
MAGDGLAAFGPNSHRFDLIVSNPPYIADAELPGLQREVRDHEPLLALTSGVDGLSMIKRLLLEAPGLLIDGGHMILEIGFGQHEAIPTLLNQRIWKLIAVHNDLQGIPRTVVLQKCPADS